MSTGESVTDTSLLNALHEAASNVSYFNAGEGDCYRMEAGARAAAKSQWNALVEEAINRGIYDPADFKDYLL
jgi:hypothetical protein